MPPDATPAPLPVLVIGGYLGAGKTTLVNHLLRQAGGQRIAVLVNDFGDVNINAELIAGEADGCPSSAGVLSLAGGCLCCSFGDDLVGTLTGLARRDPAPDLVDGATLAGLLAGLPGLAPQARCLACAVADLPPALVLGWRATADGAAHDDANTDANADSNANSNADADSLGRMTARPIAAVAAPASRAFESRSWPLPAGTDLHALGAALAAPGSGVLRAKALAVCADGSGQVLQVAGGRWSVTPARVQGQGRLVLIGLRGRMPAVSQPVRPQDEAPQHALPPG